MPTLQARSTSEGHACDCKAAPVPRWRFGLALIFASLAVSQSRAEDAVVFLGGKGGKENVRRTGTINDYSGAGLVITTSSGRQETIPAEKVLEIQSTSSKEEASGDALKAGSKLRCRRRRVSDFACR
jgi:hypothetical protein